MPTATIRSISEIFAEPFSIAADPEGYTTSDRRTLISGIHQYRSRSSTLVMEVSGEETFLDGQGGGEGPGGRVGVGHLHAAPPGPVVPVSIRTDSDGYITCLVVGQLPGPHGILCLIEGNSQPSP